MRLKAMPLSVRSAPAPTPPSHGPDPLGPRRRRMRDILATLPILLLLPLLLLPFGTASAGGTLIISPSELATRPTSGSAWNALLEVARGSLGVADLTDQDNKHGVRVFAAALAGARLNDATLKTKARNGIMAAIGTERVGAGNSALALGRQLSAYVMAADVVGLSAADDATFKSWLSTIRTRNLGGHTLWYSLVRTHEYAPNNWGSFAGASRIAASLYLGDSADVARAVAVMRGFLGERSQYAGFRAFGSEALTWACSSSTATPISPPCTKSGINVDGAIIEDIGRGGSLRWPPGDSGQSYTLESLQGLVLQAELLSRAGYPAWGWSSQALKRASNMVTRFSGWNNSSVDRHITWLLNKRYGLGLPTEPAGMGRGFGFTDWLYGPAGSGTPAPTPTPTATPRPTPTPTPRPTPAPTPAPTSTPTATPTGTPTPQPTATLAATPTPTGSPAATATPAGTPGPTATPTDAPAATPTATPRPTSTPRPTPEPTPEPTPTPQPPADAVEPDPPSVGFVTTTSVGTSTVPLRVRWGPSGQVYQLQERVNDDGYESIETGTIVGVTRTARNGYEYRYRVRAREGSDWTDWATSPEVDVLRLSERHGSIAYRGTWRSAASSKYIGGRVRYSTQRRAKATFEFTGRSIALIGPKGPTRGKAKIYIDGRYVKTISQYSSRYRPREVFFARTWSKAGDHRITVLVLRTPGHPMVAIDAIYILR